MGLSSSTKTNDPSKFAKPYITEAANTATSAYDANAPKLQAGVDSVTGLLPDAITSYQAGNPNLNAATDYNTGVLSGKYLGQGNPYLQQQIDNTNNDVRNQDEAALGRHGLTGGSDYTQMITKDLAQNESALRYGDYSNERNWMGQAAGQAPAMTAADSTRLAPIMSLLGAYGMPIDAANAHAQTIAGLLGNYQTQTSSPSLASSIGKGFGIAGSIFPGSPFGAIGKAF